MLSADGVARSFAGEQVLSEVSLSVEPGEVVAVIGPSGVGKTTLLRTLSLFEPPDAGTVTYDGTDVWVADEEDRLAARRSIGVVFQTASLFDTSVRRNVGYGLQVRQSWTDRVRTTLESLFGRDRLENGEVSDALELVGLEAKADQAAMSLSGGEAQRIAFARAVAYDPDLLLLDEPTSELDPRNTALIEEAIDAARDRGLGVAIATHDMHQARRIADRVAVLLADSIVEVGPTETVFEDPSEDRTRRFINGDLVY
jgi:tungstate transport system ATP-binding protein